MGKKFKKVLAWVLAVTFAISVIPMSPVMAEDEGEAQFEGAPCIYINQEGILFDGAYEASEFWKLADDGTLVPAYDEAGEPQDDWIIRYVKNDNVGELTLRNCSFDGKEGSAIFSQYPLTVNLEGENIITTATGSALITEGDLTIQGAGTLRLESTASELPGEDGSTYTPGAMEVYGKFTNRSDVVCSSKNEEATAVVVCGYDDICNTGTLKVENGYFIADDSDGDFGIMCNGLEKPVAYSGDIADYPVPTDHVYVAKAYYYTPQELYPNLQMNIEGAAGWTDWKIYGKYDENGKPIGSHVWYQWWFVDKNGGPLTEDIQNPTQFLVYDEEPEKLIKDKDIVSIQDGGKHTFDADIYALWFNDGDVTVNGNIIQDFTCANIRERCEPADGNWEHLGLKKDESGNPVWAVESTADSKVTINGNVGLLSLNDSFVGNVLVTGKVDLLGLYHDTDPSIEYTDSYVPEEFFGSIANAGQIVKNGEYTKKGIELEGYEGYRVFNTEDFYSITRHTVGTEEVHGTSAAIGSEELTIDVTGTVGDDTYPCVKEAGEERNNQVLAVLSDKEKQPLVMDISLIQENAKKIEPEKSINLYLGNVKGFTQPAIYHIKDDGTIEKLGAYDKNDVLKGSLSCKTNSFSTYFIAENQELLTDNINKSTENVTINASSQCKVSEGTPAMTLKDSIENLLKWINLSEDEKKLIDSGTKTEIILSATVKTPSQEEVELANKILGEAKIGQWLDLNLLLQLQGRDARAVTELTSPMTIQISVPDSLLNKDSTVERTYKILRIHDGEAVMLDASFDASGKTISFATDKYSAYAIAYIDKKIITANPDVKPADPAPAVNPTAPAAPVTPTANPTAQTANPTPVDQKGSSAATGDKTPIAQTAAILIIGGCVLYAAYRRRKRV